MTFQVKTFTYLGDKAGQQIHADPHGDGRCLIRTGLSSMKLAWNAIVKNEAKVIRRCVESLLPWIDCAIVVDTGSTDETVDIIREMFAKANKPVEIYQASFINFEQARNEALKRARDSKMEWDYLLLVDADMELKVNRPNWLDHVGGGFSYDMHQRAGGLGYLNRRIISRDTTGWYVGVTHEYLDTGPSSTLDGAEFIDHADGANRPDKLQRDIDLLEKALETETRRGMIERYTFYLANSYFDAGNTIMAAHHYKRRVAMGGFEEERFVSQYKYAWCMNRLGNIDSFALEMLKAHNMRPSRPEPLYDLAKYYRETNQHHTSLLFSEAGMRQPRCDDLLFVNEYAHDIGFREEFAICAYYDPNRRERGAKVSDLLTLDYKANEFTRNQARNNQYWYLKPLTEHIWSCRAKRIPVTPPDGWVPLNPSVVMHDGKPLVLVRTVNYTITSEGQYEIRGTDGTANRDNPISTRNYLVSLDNKFGFVNGQEIGMPKNWPKPKYPLVIGFEDSRLFEVDGQLWTSSTVRELTDEGWCEQVLAQLINADDRSLVYGDDWLRILPEKRQHEKNWMPWVRNDALQFVYRPGVLIDVSGKEIISHKSIYNLDHISGGTQVVKIDGDEYLALVHEAGFIPGRGHNRYYQHRFLLLDGDGKVENISLPFVFHDRQIEFAAGLALLNKRQIVISYGIRDCEAWLMTMHLSDVRRFIEGDR